MAILDGRKSQVLRAVVEDYVRSAEPVGSRTIARRYAIGFSPATIRNDMADLGELGYLDQPHTSAGRVPSDKGYRYYVDQLMRRRAVAARELDDVRQRYRAGARSVEWLLQQTVTLLAEATAYAAVGVGPERAAERLRSLEALGIGDGETLLILVTSSGMVHHRLLENPDGVRFDDVRETVAILEERLTGLTVSELGREALDDIFRAFRQRRRLLDEVVDMVVASLLREASEEAVLVAGASNIMGQPEFQEVTRLRALLGFLERPDAVRELLLPQAEGIEVHIGAEIPLPSAADLSLVMAGLRRQGGTLLRFGLIGPRRMDYERAVSLVEAVAQELEGLL